MQQRPVSVSLLLIVGTIAAGLTIRMAPLGLHSFVVKYCGSMLWAAMIYWIVTTLRQRWSFVSSAIAAGAIALCVELFKLHHTPGLDAFRLTLAGKLLLGRVFSVFNLVAYAVAITAAAFADHRIRVRVRPKSRGAASCGGRAAV